MISQNLKSSVPKHVAIIMDGNGRWAKQHQFDRAQGHIEGVKRVEEIVDAADEIGIKILTLFTFSTENWNRPKKEVTLLMRMLIDVLGRKLKKLKKNNVKFLVIGRKDPIPNKVQEILDKTIEETKNNTGLIMNLAFNYGARREITDAVKQIAIGVKEGRLKVEDINEEDVNQCLYTHELPDPDLLIRTSGEKRISNFLLWQLSYTELYFTDIFWPEFTVEEFKKAISDYQSRERRYGNLAVKK